MKYPFTISGTIDVPTEDPDDVEEALRNQLPAGVVDVHAVGVGAPLEEEEEEDEG